MRTSMTIHNIPDVSQVHTSLAPKVIRSGLAKKGGFFWHCVRPDGHARPRVSASAQARTTPGNPPPLPRSTQTWRMVRGQQLQRIGDVPSPQDSEASTAQQDLFWPATQEQRNVPIKPLPLFHVKRGSEPTRRLCRLQSTGDSACVCFAGLAISLNAVSASRIVPTSCEPSWAGSRRIGCSAPRPSFEAREGAPTQDDVRAVAVALLHGNRYALALAAFRLASRRR